MRLHLTAAVLLPVGLVAAQQPAPMQSTSARHAFTPADWYKVTTLSTPALSPDGSKVAFTVTTVREAENRRHSEVWVVPAQSGEPARYTSPGFESSNPRFSDDGKTLYFTSQRPGGRGTNWALRMDQPAGEAFQPDRAPQFQQGSQPADKSFTIISEGGGGRGGAAGRGGGGRGGRGGQSEGDSAAVNPNDPFARMQPMARPPYDAITKPENPGRFDGRQITQMAYKANGQSMLPGPSVAPRTAAAPVPAQLFIERSGTPRKQLTETKYSHRDAVVSPDGKWIAFIADANLRSDSLVTAERDSVAKLAPDRKRDEQLRNETDVYVLPVAACEAKTAECTPRKLEYFGNESQLAWSPDSKQIAFVGQPSRFKNQRLLIVPASGGKAQDILGAWPYEPGTIRWLKNGSLAMMTSIRRRRKSLRYLGDVAW
jgi:dipeptidyl aminopeptidase/acylaminoacyl peptidase